MCHTGHYESRVKLIGRIDYRDIKMMSTQQQPIATLQYLTKTVNYAWPE